MSWKQTSKRKVQVLTQGTEGKVGKTMFWNPKGMQEVLKGWGGWRKYPTGKSDADQGKQRPQTQPQHPYWLYYLVKSLLFPVLFSHLQNEADTVCFPDALMFDKMILHVKTQAQPTKSEPWLEVVHSNLKYHQERCSRKLLPKPLGKQRPKILRGNLRLKHAKLLEQRKYHPRKTTVFITNWKYLWSSYDKMDGTL